MNENENIDKIIETYEKLPDEMKAAVKMDFSILQDIMKGEEDDPNDYLGMC